RRRRRGRGRRWGRACRPREHAACRSLSLRGPSRRRPRRRYVTVTQLRALLLLPPPRSARLAAMRRDRGVTFVTVLILLAIAAGFYWIITFGEAYWDNQEVKGVLSQAANMAYKETDDEHIRNFVF